MLVKVVFIGVSVCLVNILLKKYSNEFVLPTEIVFLALAVALSSEYLQEAFAVLTELVEGTEYGSEILTSSIKGAGICLLTRFSTDICLESGNKLVSDVIEFTGRIMLLVIAMPYIESIIKIAVAFAE